MRRVCAITAGLAAALWLGAGPALAFEQTPEAPADQAPQIAPVTKAPAAELQSPAAGTSPNPEKSGTTLFGFSLLPKLDVGLELLYGQEQQTELQQGAPPEGNDDLTVVGKVKRHF
jgi:hypothetical protein